ncbi:hypothetical protein A20C1_03523 [marine actinobacterium PHSC20C1]|nr:hypothetical protein A20C1_03523 [marine actinobacterium PHSC20C1]
MGSLELIRDQLLVEAAHHQLDWSRKTMPDGQPSILLPVTPHLAGAILYPFLGRWYLSWMVPGMAKPETIKLEKTKATFRNVSRSISSGVAMAIEKSLYSQPESALAYCVLLGTIAQGTGDDDLKELAASLLQRVGFALSERPS